MHIRNTCDHKLNPHASPQMFGALCVTVVFCYLYLVKPSVTVRNLYLLIALNLIDRLAFINIIPVFIIICYSLL